MLKYAMLAGAMTIAAPAVAQTAPTGQAAPTTATGAVQAEPAQATTGATDPVQAATPAADAATTPQADAAATAPAQGDQVAQAVDQQFASYDKDGNGALSRTEFADWMVALKSQSDPATKADSPATKKWVGAAFAQADTDRNRTLSKAEVTGFLAQGQSQQG